VLDTTSYTFDIGRRGALTSSRADLDAMGSKVALTPGI
jgi:hypothetical protein